MVRQRIAQPAAVQGLAVPLSSPEAPGEQRTPLRAAAAVPEAPGEQRTLLRAAAAVPEAPGKQRTPLRAAAVPEAPGELQRQAVPVPGTLAAQPAPIPSPAAQTRNWQSALWQGQCALH